MNSLTHQQMKARSIYRITNDLNNKVYIGSTVDLDTRWRKHKRPEEAKDHPMSAYMKEHGYDHFSIEEICQVVGTKIQARQTEQSEIDKLGPDIALNQRRAITDKETRRIQHRGPALAYTRRNVPKLRAYYQANREKILAKRALNRDAHKAYMREYHKRKKNVAQE